MMYHKLHHWKNISPSEVRGKGKRMTDELLDRARELTETTWEDLRDELWEAIGSGYADKIDFDGFVEAYSSYDRFVGGYCGERNGDRPADHYGIESQDWPSWSAIGRTRNETV